VRRLLSCSLWALALASFNAGCGRHFLRLSLRRNKNLVRVFLYYTTRLVWPSARKQRGRAAHTNTYIHAFWLSQNAAYNLLVCLQHTPAVECCALLATPRQHHIINCLQIGLHRVLRGTGSNPLWCKFWRNTCLCVVGAKL
jgi:hypothetical protein